MSALITRRRLMYAVITVVVALAILSFVLPYVGSGNGGLTPLP